MKLGDVVWRASLRKRSTSDIEIASKKVFEVTDLTIPAGTDWTGPHEIGRFPLEPHTGVLAFVSLEISAPIEVGNLVFGTPSLVGSGGSVTLGGNNVRLIAAGGILPTGEVEDAYGFWGDYAPPDDGVIVAFSMADPTAADIHVIRARAAFTIL